MKNLFPFAVVSAVCAAIAAPLAHAAPPQTEAALAQLHAQDAAIYGQASDAIDRIRYSDRLSMLTQRVAAASCAKTSGVGSDVTHNMLQGSMEEMDIILDALRNGNENLHILGPENDRRILHDIELLSAEWTETHIAVEAVLADASDTDSAHIIDDHNMSLLSQSQILASDILGKYSHPFEVTKADAFLISLAGRQRMLSQKMAKDACEIWTGYNAESGREDLIKTMTIFENSLNALRHGKPELGISAAPNDEIATVLDDLLARWATLRVNLDGLLAGEELAPEQKFDIISGFDEELHHLEKLVRVYNKYAKGRAS